MSATRTAVQEMGCSRKVAVARARVLDIVVCRHSLCLGVLCGGLARVSSSLVNDLHGAVLGRVVGRCRQTPNGRARAQARELAQRRSQRQRSAGQAVVVLCGVLSAESV